MPRVESLPGLAIIEEILSTAITTAFVQDSIPISCLVCGPSGAGKSKTVLRLQGPTLHRTDDLTSAGLYEILRNDPMNKIRHIVLGDFNPVLSHKSSVSSLTIASMLSVMSDGTARIDDGRRTKEVKHSTVAFLTACTTEMFSRNLNKWAELGIPRRFLTLFYRYSLETELAGLDLISKGKITLGSLEPTIFKPLKPRAVIIPPAIESRLREIAATLAENLGYRSVWKKKGNVHYKEMQPNKSELRFTPLLTLQTMIKAHAMMRKKFRADETDLKFIQKMMAFTNPALPGSV